jgi:YD repeat-containing protein
MSTYKTQRHEDVRFLFIVACAQATGYQYDQLGRRESVAYGNNTSITYEYDIADRLTGLANNLNGSAITYDYTEYDKVGNRLACSIDGQDDQVYSYDKLYQLTYVDYNDSNKTWYYYDKLGNRTKMTKNTVNTLYDSNALNQYRTVGGVNYTYDANGNLTYDGTHTYAYDCENRLLNVDGGDTIRFSVNALISNL